MKISMLNINYRVHIFALFFVLGLTGIALSQQFKVRYLDKNPNSVLWNKVDYPMTIMIGAGYYPSGENLSYYIYDEFVAFRLRRKEMEAQRMLYNLYILIKGIDDGIKETKEQDYFEAKMNALLQAIEKAGADIKSITKLESDREKYEMLENKVKEFLLPGYNIMDIGYQLDGKYLVILSGQIRRH